MGAGAFCSDASIPDRVIWRPVGGSAEPFFQDYINPSGTLQAVLPACHIACIKLTPSRCVFLGASFLLPSRFLSPANKTAHTMLSHVRHQSLWQFFTVRAIQSSSSGPKNKLFRRLLIIVAPRYGGQDFTPKFFKVVSNSHSEYPILIVRRVLDLRRHFVRPFLNHVRSVDWPDYGSFLIPQPASVPAFFRIGRFLSTICSPHFHDYYISIF
jgi:hypothetical protein